MTASNNTMINPYSPSFHFLLLILLFEPIRLCLSFETNSDGYTSCNNTLFKCGNVTADYPFWGGDRLSGCGHPELKLHCQENIPTLDINQVTYRVLQIDGYSKILQMARNDYYEGELCVSKYVNSTFNPSILELAYGFNYLGIFYECFDYTQSLAYCSANQSSNTTSSVYAAYESLPGCLVRVDVPVGVMNYGYGYVEVNQKLKEGFKMRVNVWESAECEACNSSGGKCGYDSESNPTCYCLNGNENSTKCFATESKNVEKGNETALLKIVLPVAGVSILFLVMLGSFCYIRQHRKIKRLDSESYTKQDLPNSPTTTRSVSTKVTSTRTMYFGTHVFSYSELEQATNSFDSSKELGEGGFGTVYYGKLNDGREVAVKRLYERNFKSMEQFMNEVQILARLRYPSLVMLHGCTSRHSRELLLVYEYISNGTLADHLHGNKSNSGSMNWHLRLNIAIETADALAYLHSLDIIHRDVKTTNILIDENFHVKVADFGLSRLFPTNATHVSTAPQGTPGYVDPEYHRCYQLTTKSDVYSFGVVLMELISSKKAVDITRHRHDINLFNMAINRIQNGTLDELVDPQLGFSTDSSIRREINMFSEMAFLCLQQDTEMRPTMEEVVQSLKNIRNKDLSLSTPCGIIDEKLELMKKCASACIAGLGFSS